MNLKLKKNFVVVLLFASVLFFLLGMVFFSFDRPSALADTSTAMTVEKYQGSKFDNNGYKSSFKITANEIASYTANGGERDTFALDNAFDTADKTYWISQQGNTETFTNHVIVTFTKELSFQSMSFSSAYYTRDGVRHFSGYPTLLKVYAANGNDDFNLVGVCESTPKKDFSEAVVFSLASAVKCDRVKIEFAEVSVYAGVFDGVAVVSAMDISLFKPDEYLITKTSAQLDADYVSVYKVPTSVMTYEANCGASGSNVLANAFDGNWTSGWVAGKDNGNKEGNNIIITVNFSQPVLIDRIMYQSSNLRTGYGYPTRLKIHIANGDEPLRVYGDCLSSATSDRVIFQLKDSVTVTQLAFEWAEVCTSHKWQPTAQEIQFLQPENADVQKTLNIFSDYTQHTVKSEFNTVPKLTALRDSVKSMISYEGALKPLLDRAEACINGYITKDVHREFQTDPEARNPINQYGNMANYARNTLLLNSIGTNRQVIGVGGVTGEEIVVYVDAEPNDKLPSIVFTQIYGAWNSWSKTVSLKRGKNVFTFPNSKSGGSYTVPVNAGGPIHVVNPYTPEEQSHNVKLYFEGGYIYPVFHDGDDETTFKMILDDYYTRLKDPNNNAITIDAFEAVSDSIILSCTASRAYAGYITNNWSPQLNIDRWNLYVRKLLSFGGVDCVEGGTYYTEKNKHITINYRAVQPYAGMYAFAAGEHIGIPDAGTHVAMVLKGSTGWAFAHEFGHTVDLRGRIWGEVTNNMWAIYDRYMIEGNYDNRVNLGSVSGKIASDFSPQVGNLWNSGTYNSSFWFMIEGGHPGYWAASENNYRYEKTNHPEDVTLIGKLGKTELMLYYGSLATGDDLRDYFERWGFFMNGDGTFTASNRWARSKQSDALKELMQKAIDGGRIASTCKKYWYIDINQYRYLKQYNEKLGDWASCYHGSETVNINSVMTVGNTYTLLLPTPSNQEAHLGYEIQSKIDGEWKVVGFTYNSSFTDTYDYKGAMPVYRVVAYDRMLNHSGVSQEQTAQPDTAINVCKIGDTHYNTLKEAVDASKDGDIILLLKSCYAGGISFSHKKVVICPDGEATEDLVITKSSSGPMFYLSTSEYKWDTSLQIGNTSAKGARIVLDGNNFYQSGALVHSVWSPVSLNNVLLRNNQNSGNGGGIYVGMETTLNLKAVTVENNSAVNGGGLYLDGRTRVHLNGVTIKNNTASNRGGGVYITETYGGSTLTNTNSKTSANFITGNTANYGGGIYTENGVNLFNVEISENNAALQGGGIYANVSYGRGNIGMTTCKMLDNTAPVGSTIYMNRGKVYLNGGKYGGEFYKLLSGSDKPQFYLNMAMPDFSDAQFELPAIAKEGTALVDGITNMTATEEQTKTMTIKNGHSVLTADNKVLVQSDYVNVKINYNGGVFEYACPLGRFQIPECIPEFSPAKYFTGWEIDGKQYQTGDEIVLTQNITARATVENYCVVTVNYGSTTETKYFKVNDVYYMPMNTPDKKPILGFDGSDGKHYVYADGAKITGDVTFTAVMKKMVNLTSIVGDETHVTAYEYNRTVILTEPQAPEGMFFRHWLIDGTEHAGNSSVKLTADLTATAVFSKYCRVETRVGDETTLQELLPNYLLRLDAPKEMEGKIFLHWLVDGVEYFAGADYTVGKDVSIVAVYGDIPEEEEKPQVTVTLQYFIGTEQVEEIQKVDLNSLYVFPVPPVEEGKVFLFWTINGVKYNSGSSIRVTQDITAVAEFVNEDTINEVLLGFVITNVTNGDSELSRYQFTAKVGEAITLSAPVEASDGYQFEYYLVDGERKEVGEEITLGLNTEIKAVYSAVTPPDTDSGKTDPDKSNKGLVIALVCVAAGIVVIGGGVGVALILKKKKQKPE